MAIPTYDQFIEPVLRYLYQHDNGASTHDVYEAAAKSLNISELEKQELLPSGQQSTYKNRAGWAHDRLKREGLSESPRRGLWRLTKAGREYVQKHPIPLSPEEIERIALSNRFTRLRQENIESSNMSKNAILLVEKINSTVSPDDRLEQALSELRATAADELLDMIGKASPKFFELLVLELLYKMGYGESREALQHVGRAKDGGIDGVISLDRLGLEKVFIQAKRWQSSIGPELVQSFVGALERERTSKGVFITTSTFTSSAINYVESIRKVVLIDGEKLANYLIEFGVAVTHREIKIPKIDHDFFDEQ